MINTCTHTSQLTTYNQYDPTHTLTLRNRFAGKFSARLRELRGVLRETIIDRDSFGLESLNTQQINPGGRGQFDYPSDSEKIAFFLEWLRDQLEGSLIGLSNVYRNIDASWTNRYVQQAYERGVRQARQELQKQRYSLPDIETIGIDAILQRPKHRKMLDNLQRRVLNEVEGLVNDIIHYAGRIVSDSLAKGHSREFILRRLNIGLIQGNDREELGLTTLIGSFVAIERRSDMIARSEVVRAVAESALVEYEYWGVEQVGLEPELKLSWVTAGDSKVCVRCRAKAAQGPYKISEVKGMIPLHPFCRCWLLPTGKEN